MTDYYKKYLKYKNKYVKYKNSLVGGAQDLSNRRGNVVEYDFSAYNNYTKWKKESKEELANVENFFNSMKESELHKAFSWNQSVSHFEAEGWREGPSKAAEWAAWRFVKERNKSEDKSQYQPGYLKFRERAAIISAWSHRDFTDATHSSTWLDALRGAQNHAKAYLKVRGFVPQSNVPEEKEVEWYVKHLDLVNNLKRKEMDGFVYYGKYTEEGDNKWKMYGVKWRSLDNFRFGSFADVSTPHEHGFAQFHNKSHENDLLLRYVIFGTICQAAIAGEYPTNVEVLNTLMKNLKNNTIGTITDTHLKQLLGKNNPELVQTAVEMFTHSTDLKSAGARPFKILTKDLFRFPMELFGGELSNPNNKIRCVCIQEKEYTCLCSYDPITILRKYITDLTNSDLKNLFPKGYDKDEKKALKKYGAQEVAALVAMSHEDRAEALAAKSHEDRAEALAAVLAALPPKDREAALEKMSPEDKAAVLAAISPEDKAAVRAAVLTALPLEARAAALSLQEAAALGSLPLEGRAAALAKLSPEDRAVVLVAAVSPEDKAAVLAAMPPKDREPALENMSPEDREVVEAQTFVNYVQKIIDNNNYTIMDNYAEFKKTMLPILTKVKEEITKQEREKDFKIGVLRAEATQAAPEAAQAPPGVSPLPAVPPETVPAAEGAAVPSAEAVATQQKIAQAPLETKTETKETVASAEEEAKAKAAAEAKAKADEEAKADEAKAKAAAEAKAKEKGKADDSTNPGAYAGPNMLQTVFDGVLAAGETVLDNLPSI